jgi:hypothetical protein
LEVLEKQSWQRKPSEAVGMKIGGIWDLNLEWSFRRFIASVGIDVELE